MSATRPAPKRRGSLRIKIIAWSLGPAVIVLTAVALVTFLAYQQVTADLVIDRDRELARLTAGELAAELGEYPGLLEAAARDLTASENTLAAPLAGLAEIRHRLVYFDGGTVLLNNLGRVMAAEPLRPEILGVDWSTRPYFRALIQRTGQPAFSDVMPEGPGGASVIAIAVPVLNNQSEFLGALVGMFRVSADAINPFYGTLLRLRLERQGTAYVIDGQGQVIYASDPGQIGSDLAGHPVAGQALAGQVGAVRIRALDGREALASYGPVPDTAWSLIIEEDWAELTRVIRGYGRALLTLLAMGVVIPAAVVLVGARRITGPIAALVQATRQVASGHFGQTVAANTGDELEALADQFNRMSAQLKQSYGQLEQRVDERTRQLSTLLRISRDVTSTLELEPLLGQILDQLKMVVDYGGAGILVLEAGRLRFRAYRGMTDPELVFNLQFPLAESFAGQVLAAGQPMIVADMQADSPQNAAIPPAARQRLRMVFHDLRSMLAVPLLVKEQSTGLLILFHDRARYFSTADAELTAAFAAQSAVAIENARLFEARQRRAEQLGVI
ncbi:MAG: GAF domain-containing protein, partial [Anaerolineales bacterium]|nr:GAF domain-containing protein [Anaerolineales bacterium]